MLITIGNDELILHIRKNGFGAGKSTARLGRELGEWLTAHGATMVEPDRPSLWGSAGDFVSADVLPKTATQFRFDVGILPQLFQHLSTL